MDVHNGERTDCGGEGWVGWRRAREKKRDGYNRIKNKIDKYY